MDKVSTFKGRLNNGKNNKKVKKGKKKHLQAKGNIAKDTG